MKKLLLFLILLASPCFAGQGMGPGPGVGAFVPADLLNIDFENYTVPTTTLLSPLSTTAGTNTVETAGGSKRMKQVNGTNLANASISTQSSVKITATVRQIGTPDSTEGMFASVLIIAPNGTDYYRMYLDVRTSDGAGVISKNGSELVGWTAPPFTDNLDHNVEFIVAQSGGNAILTINVDSVEYASYTDSSPHTSFNLIKFQGSSVTGTSSANGIYWDNIIANPP